MAARGQAVVHYLQEVGQLPAVAAADLVDHYVGKRLLNLHCATSHLTCARAAKGSTGDRLARLKDVLLRRYVGPPPCVHWGTEHRRLWIPWGFCGFELEIFILFFFNTYKPWDRPI